ncbi:MAG: hypothetical protein GX607_04515 [Myxococcales bacterium]|mgnify:FL=1|jgi:hypothetical protein|nr:hypothetical protein [Myxococcales bacterium]
MATKKRTTKKSSKSTPRAAKKAPARTSTSQPTIRQGDKAAFVRSLPRSMPASEVVERAADKGMVISKAYVHNIRSAANKQARSLLSKEGKKTIKGPKKKLESQFRELVITLGPARAKKLLSQVELSLAIAGKKMGRQR